MRKFITPEDFYFAEDAELQAAVTLWEQERDARGTSAAKRERLQDNIDLAEGELSQRAGWRKGANQ